MPDTDIDSAAVTDVTGTITSYSVDQQETEGPSNTEITWQSKYWNRNLGYYRKVPELKTAIDTKANWTVGAGYVADPITDLMLGTIRGNGKDTFNSILKNAVKIKTIDGDSYAEIIRNKQGHLLNLKPLNPGSIKIYQNKKGRILKYEQTTTGTKFQPDDIFHLSRDRIANEIHGESVIDAVEEIILMRNEAMHDWKRVMHRNVDPMWVHHLDTDDTTEIAAFKVKMDNARKYGENLYVPKGVVVPELITTAQNASLNPLPWINQLNDYFFQAVNVPQIIIGQGKEFTDASGKIVYLSYEQSVKAEQLYIEEQLLSQLNIALKLNFPASLQQEALSSAPDATTLQEEEQRPAAEGNDTTEELEGKT